MKRHSKPKPFCSWQRTLSIHNLNTLPNILVLPTLNLWAQHSATHWCQTNTCTGQRGMVLTKMRAKSLKDLNMCQQWAVGSCLEVKTWPLFLKITCGLASGLNQANSTKFSRLKGNLIAAFHYLQGGHQEDKSQALYSNAWWGDEGQRA